MWDVADRCQSQPSGFYPAPSHRLASTRNATKMLSTKATMTVSSSSPPSPLSALSLRRKRRAASTTTRRRMWTQWMWGSLMAVGFLLISVSVCEAKHLHPRDGDPSSGRSSQQHNSQDDRHRLAAGSSFNNKNNNNNNSTSSTTTSQNLTVRKGLALGGDRMLAAREGGGLVTGADDGQPDRDQAAGRPSFAQVQTDTSAAPDPSNGPKHRTSASAAATTKTDKGRRTDAAEVRKRKAKHPPGSKVNRKSTPRAEPGDDASEEEEEDGEGVMGGARNVLLHEAVRKMLGFEPSRPRSGARARLIPDPRVPPPMPQYVLDLYKKYQAGQLGDGQHWGNTVRSIPAEIGEVNGEAMFIFNLSSIPPTERVLRAHVHLYKKPSSEFHESDPRRSHRHRHHRKRKDGARMRREDTELVLYEVAPHYLSQTGAIILRDGAKGWQWYGATEAVLSCLLADRLQPHLFALSFRAQRPNGKARPLALKRFVRHHSLPFLILYSNETEHVNLEELDIVAERLKHREHPQQQQQLERDGSRAQPGLDSEEANGSDNSVYHHVEKGDEKKVDEIDDDQDAVRVEDEETVDGDEEDDNPDDGDDDYEVFEPFGAAVEREDEEEVDADDYVDENDKERVDYILEESELDGKAENGDVAEYSMLDLFRDFGEKKTPGRNHHHQVRVEEQLETQTHDGPIRNKQGNQKVERSDTANNTTEFGDKQSNQRNTFSSSASLEDGLDDVSGKSQLTATGQRVSDASAASSASTSFSRNSASPTEVERSTSSSDASRKRRSLLTNEIPDDAEEHPNSRYLYPYNLPQTHPGMLTARKVSHPKPDDRIIPYPAAERRRKDKTQLRKRRKHRKRKSRRRNRKSRRRSKLPDKWEEYQDSVAVPDAQPGPAVCSRRRMVVDFADIGWGDWIISPKSFEAHYCAGTCPFPLTKKLRPSNHATIQSIVNAIGLYPNVPAPCCVPDAMTSVTLLYFDENRNVVLKNYPGMSVQSCACR